MIGQFPERSFQGLERVKVLLSGFVLLHAADFGLQRFMRGAHLVDEAFDMTGNSGAGLFSVLDAGNEAQHRVINASDRQRRACFCRFDSAREALQRRSGVLLRARLRAIVVPLWAGRIAIGRIAEGRAIIRRPHVLIMGFFRRHQQAIEILSQRYAFRHRGFARGLPGSLIDSLYAPGPRLAHCAHSLRTLAAPPG